MSPSLSPLLPPPGEMDAIINGVVEEIARYSHLAPSLALSAEIIREAESRRQDILGNLGDEVNPYRSTRKCKYRAKERPE